MSILILALMGAGPCVFGFEDQHDSRIRCNRKHSHTRNSHAAIILSGEKGIVFCLIDLRIRRTTHNRS